ncbi:helix-hairpin-helix domain-containing protein [Nocardioides sp. LMS-CY]|nr:helix-hairpin-helix domain-containing protein [Nocardioides sp. LMS-CY]
MRVRAEHVGRGLPFERDRRLVLRRLPVDAVVQRAVLTLTPVSTDAGGRFLETLSFGDGRGDWGATKVATSTAVEIDLHARRRLASLTGTNLGTAHLLADLGGGFLAVDSEGGFGDNGTFALGNAVTLPGICVTGLRAPTPTASAPDISQLRVSSPPSNVTVAVEGGPVFFTHLGDLMDPVTTPDFADLLQGLLADLDVENGCVVVPFVLHSDTIARLDLVLEIDYAIEAGGLPDGVASAQAQYAFGGAPVAGQGALSVTAPPGLVAVAGGTTGRVQGAFAETRVVFGAVTGALPPELVSVGPGQSLAQQIVLPGARVASSVDLLLTAVTAEAALAIDIVDDLDGKPGRTSLLSRPADLRLTRDDAGSPTWLSVPLPAETELAAGTTRWVVVQARTGSAAWSAGPDDGDAVAPGLQTTRDGGLSWRRAEGRSVTAPLRAPLRLRHTTPGFEMPLELRVGAGGAEVAVDLQRFAASGTVDFGLDFPEVAEAFNAALAAAGARPDGGGERVANGDFVTWYRVGSAVARSNELRLPEATGLRFGLAAFGRDSGLVHTVVQGDGDASYVGFDVFSGAPTLQQRIGDGTPVALAMDAPGRTALVSMVDFSDAVIGRLGSDSVVLAAAGADGPTIRGGLLLVDTATGRPSGGRVATPEPVIGLAAAPDGQGVYVVGWDVVADETRSVVRHVGWSDLRAAAAGAELAWSTLPRTVVSGQLRHVTVAPDGRLVLLVAGPDGDVAAGGSAGEVLAYADRAAVAAGDAVRVPAPADAVQVAATPDGAKLLVLARAGVTYLRSADLATLDDVAFLDEAGGAGQALGIAPTGDVAAVVRREAVNVLDVPNRRWLTDPGFSVPVGRAGGQVVVNAAGTHAAVVGMGMSDGTLVAIGAALPADWEVTAGAVRPVSLPATGEVLALLGDPRGISGRVATQAAAISQVVPVTGAVRYRISFDGLSLVEGGVAQVRWLGDRCRPGRVDRVPVTSFDVESGGSVERIPHHEAVLTSPADATQAEVRFHVPEAAMAIDKVSLLPSLDVASGAWTPDDPATTVTAAGAGTVVSNGGAATSTVSQVAAVRAGDLFELTVEATTSGEPGAAVELGFADDAGAVVGDVPSVPLDPLDFDDRAASGTVPDGAVEATLRLVLPPGAVVELRTLSLSVGAAAEVELYFASQAPGELRVSDVGVRFEADEPQPLPVPPGGLCPATPTGEGPDGEACHCQACGTTGPVRQAAAAVTPAGRPVVVTPCPTCGTDRVRLGGKVVRGAQRPLLRQFEVHDRQVALRVGEERRPAVESRVRVDEPLEAVDGIAESRATLLRAHGVRDLVALSRADAAALADLPGVSRGMAESFIAQARMLVRERGVRVVFD